MRSNRGWFRRGFDPRRHPLTTEERSRGGRTTWTQIMADLRLNLNLPLLSPEMVEAARMILWARAHHGKRTKRSAEV